MDSIDTSKGGDKRIDIKDIKKDWWEPGDGKKQTLLSDFFGLIYTPKSDCSVIDQLSFKSNNLKQTSIFDYGVPKKRYVNKSFPSEVEIMRGMSSKEDDELLLRSLIDYEENMNFHDEFDDALYNCAQSFEKSMR